MRTFLINLSAFFLLVSSAEAASLHANPSSVRPGEVSRVEIVLDTQGEELNALEGELIVPEGLSPAEVSDGGSLVGIWLERPHFSGGHIKFSGLLPGGFSGSGVLFSFSVNPAGTGDFELRAEKASFYLNDGQGTPAKMPETSIPLRTVSDAAPGTVREDRDPPESFLPEIARDEDEFEGRWFLSFATTDKISGVDHYEVMEVPTGPWRRDVSGWTRVESPYILKDQSRRSDVFVRAVDKAGNFRIVQVPAVRGNQQWLYVALVIGLVCLMVIWRGYRAYHTWRSAP